MGIDTTINKVNYNELIKRGFVRVSFGNIQGRVPDIIRHWEKLEPFYDAPFSTIRANPGAYPQADSKIHIDIHDDDGKFMAKHIVPITEYLTIPDVIQHAANQRQAGFSSYIMQFRRRPRVRVRVRSHRRLR
jgi:hypothetical protein